MGRKDINYTGEKRFNNQGCEMEIIEYFGVRNITVKFIKPKEVIVRNITYQNFCNGQVNNPYFPSVYGVGYYGECKKMGKKTKEYKKMYKVWQSMLCRAYDEKFYSKEVTYTDVEVCEEWHNFQNFKKWYVENYYELENEKVELDKDFKKKGNKIYSPDTCLFLPKKINRFLVKPSKDKELPTGVYRKNGKFYTRLFKENKTKGFDTIDEAINVYKTQKKEYLLDVITSYKGKIPDNIYKEIIEAYYRYEI